MLTINELLKIRAELENQLEPLIAEHRAILKGIDEAKNETTSILSDHRWNRLNNVTETEEKKNQMQAAYKAAAKKIETLKNGLSLKAATIKDLENKWNKLTELLFLNYLNQTDAKKLYKPVHYKAFKDALTEAAKKAGLTYGYISYTFQSSICIKIGSSWNDCRPFHSEITIYNLCTDTTEKGQILKNGDIMENIKHFEKYDFNDFLKTLSLREKAEAARAAYLEELKRHEEAKNNILKEFESTELYNYIIKG